MEKLENSKVLFFIIYLIIINLVAFFTMHLDKELAKKQKRRISEKTLFTLALLFGSIGSITGMYKFRHKTKHMSFVIGMPVILVFNIICIYFIYKNNLFN
ncbi:MAG: DUF1294 domain-containing protein [Clostridia bacterium]|nr:DUF1294 domain-containing protein [Clostridia bacterium]